MNKDNGMLWSSMCSLIEIQWVLEKKIVGNSSMMCLLQKFLNLTYMWTFFIFYETQWTCLVFLLPVRS